jgi:NAD binding domain of 6-phosphogluconate dehydrogenase
MGTIGVTQTPGIRDRLAARKPGAVFADAPVPGSKEPAGPGQLLTLASGPAAAADTVGPVFDIIGRNTVRLGEAGRGSQVKLAVNGYMSVLSRARPRRWHWQTDWASATRNWPGSSRAGRWTRQSPMPSSTRRTGATIPRSSPRADAERCGPGAPRRG